ncbi:MAG: glucosyltransferase domain-containing protein [Clostridia bacterium]|nr:glucosyltransferase domain-containing protein [Clostridia bacterium]
MGTQTDVIEVSLPAAEGYSLFFFGNRQTGKVLLSYPDTGESEVIDTWRDSSEWERIFVDIGLNGTDTLGRMRRDMAIAFVGCAAASAALFALLYPLLRRHRRILGGVWRTWGEKQRIHLDLPDAACQKIWKRIPSYTKTTFFSAIASGLLTHTFMFTNKLPGWDEFWQLFHTMHYPQSGRWLQWLPAAFSTSWSMPWVNGLLGILYLSFSACLIGALLKIKTPLYCVLLAGIIQVFPLNASTFAFMQCADAYFFALLLSCLAAYLTVRYRFGFCAGIGLLACSLGIYQSYFPIAAGLFVAVLILDVLSGEDQKRILLHGGLHAATLAAGMVLYLLVARIP